MSHATKWRCRACSYDNFPANIRCTICRGPRPAPRIEDEMYRLQVTSVESSDDIISSKENIDVSTQEEEILDNRNTDAGEKPLLDVDDDSVEKTNTEKSLMQKNESGGQIVQPTDAEMSVNSQVLQQTPTKWSCKSCTFLNWPRSRKCTQCSSPRAKSRRESKSTVSGATSTRNSSTASSAEDPKQLSDDKSADEANSSSGTSSRDSHSPPSVASLEVGVLLRKWSCRQCTFYNWPRSTRCTMCGIPKSSSVSAASASSDQSTTPTVGGKLSSPPPMARLNPLSEDTSSQVPDVDTMWLEACRDIVRGEVATVERFFQHYGSSNMHRRLTKAEARQLEMPGICEHGMTLPQIFFVASQKAAALGVTPSQATNIANTLLAAYENASIGSGGFNPSYMTNKKSPRNRRGRAVPCTVAWARADEIRRHVRSIARQRKGDQACSFFIEYNTFYLPVEIEDLPRHVQDQLFTDLLDQRVQRELEVDSRAINWWVRALGSQSRLYALWNRTAGDCLLDSVMQATWGVLDKDNTLRQALAEALCVCSDSLYPRWKEYETAQAQTYNYALDESQWRRAWMDLLDLASQQGESLEQAHLFTLANLLRRPIIVYGVKYIHNWRSEPIDLAHFPGVYLPLLWERPQLCSRNPICLGYTRGHFSALVPMQNIGVEISGAGLLPEECTGDPQYLCLPLVDANLEPLEVHFLKREEMGREDYLLREWLDLTRWQSRPARFRVARMRLPRQHSSIRQMQDEWLEQYRAQARLYTSPVPLPASLPYSLQRLQHQIPRTISPPPVSHCINPSGAFASVEQQLGMRCPNPSQAVVDNSQRLIDQVGINSTYPSSAPPAQAERPSSSASSGSEKGAKVRDR